MHAEGLTSVQPLDQTIFTHNLESELYSSTNKSPHSTLKVTLKAQKVNRFYSINLFRTEKQWQKFIHKKGKHFCKFSFIDSVSLRSNLDIFSYNMTRN